MANTGAIHGFATISKQLKDGTLRLTVDVPAECVPAALSGIQHPDTPIGFAVLLISPPSGAYVAGEADAASDAASANGEFWRALHAAGFFHNPALHRWVGTDADYQGWCRLRSCATCGSVSAIQYAHTRRIAAGAGTGIKPEYSGLPMCATCHGLQHQAGESAIGGKELIDKLTAQHLEMWAKAAMRQRFGVESMREVSQREFLDRMANWNALHLVPQQHRAAA